MKYTEEHRQFILDTLLPYKTGEEKRGLSEYGTCEYLTDGGCKCAIGKWMKKGPWQHYTDSALQLFIEFDKTKILKNRAVKANLSKWVWHGIQRAHDYNFSSASVSNLEEKTGLKFPELR